MSILLSIPGIRNGSIATTCGSYIAYASKLQGKIGLKNMQAGVYKFRWFDCATGREIMQENVTVAEGDQSWDKPDGIGGELAVYIKRVRGL
jgi:hypothetical protein